MARTGFHARLDRLLRATQAQGRAAEDVALVNLSGQATDEDARVLKRAIDQRVRVVAGRLEQPPPPPVRPPTSPAGPSTSNEMSSRAFEILSWLAQLRVAYLDRVDVTVNSVRDKLKKLRQAERHSNCLRLLGSSASSLVAPFEKLFEELDTKQVTDSTLHKVLKGRLVDLMSLEQQVLNQVAGELPDSPKKAATRKVRE